MKNCLYSGKIPHGISGSRRVRVQSKFSNLIQWHFLLPDIENPALGFSGFISGEKEISL